MASNSTIPPATIPPTVPSRQREIVVIQVALLAVALAVYSLRVYSRQRIVRALGADDLVMGLAVIFTVAMSTNTSIGTKFGWGLHCEDIPLDDKWKAAFVGYMAEILYTITVSLIKISVLIFYLRLAITVTYRRIIFGGIGFVVAWLVTFTIVVVFQSIPINAYWDPAVAAAPGTRHINANVAMGVHGITNILTDLFVFILPMPMLWGVQLPKRKRIGLIALFGLGGLVCIACAMRLYYSIVVNTDQKNGTWKSLYLWTWESIEIDLGIACASIPAVKPLISRRWPGFLSSSGARSSHPSSGSFAGNGNRGLGRAVPRGPTTNPEQTTDLKSDGRAIGIREMLEESRIEGRSRVNGNMAGGYELRSAISRGEDGESRPNTGGRKVRPGRGLGESEESLTTIGSQTEILVRTDIEMHSEREGHGLGVWVGTTSKFAEK